MVTTASGVYEIYVDSKKYSGKDLRNALVIDVAATAISISVGSGLEYLSSPSEKIGYIVPLVDGTVAYFISKSTDKIKKEYLK